MCARQIKTFEDNKGVVMCATISQEIRKWQYIFSPISQQRIPQIVVARFQRVSSGVKVYKSSGARKIDGGKCA